MARRIRRGLRSAQIAVNGLRRPERPPQPNPDMTKYLLKKASFLDQLVCHPSEERAEGSCSWASVRAFCFLGRKISR